MRSVVTLLAGLAGDLGSRLNARLVRDRRILQAFCTNDG